MALKLPVGPFSVLKLAPGFHSQGRNIFVDDFACSLVGDRRDRSSCLLGRFICNRLIRVPAPTPQGLSVRSSSACYDSTPSILKSFS